MFFGSRPRSSRNQLTDLGYFPLKLMPLSGGERVQLAIHDARLHSSIGPVVPFAQGLID